MHVERSARLTAVEGRKFGLTLGAAFAVLAAVLAFRGHSLRAAASGSAGILLLLAGSVAPRSLDAVERSWMLLSQWLSRFTTPVLMAVIYFMVITPMGYFRRTLSASPVLRKRRAASAWVALEPTTKRAEQMERQF